MIILSIPFLNKQFVQKTVEKYRNKFELLEFRLDYNKNFTEFPDNLIDKKAIITIRDISEGGKSEILFSEKIEYYKKVIANHNCLVDLEINRYQKTSINPDDLILSYHNFSDTLRIEKLKEIINYSNSIPSKFLKIAVNIDKYSELFEISYLISKSNKPVIFAGMGKLGKISRLLFQQFGAVGTFVGLDFFPTANGQLTIKEVEKYYLQKISKSTKIGGIVGGKQVEKSLGIFFYNDYFRKNKIDAVYLPFVVEDLNDFWKWMEKSRIDFYGFSITMPFK
ncbi:MAG TPA: type I 3-dehydroquinate dehydratase, partial [Candidatus Cloacimonetes bacterium]|nr:type I 3-dehydroquinate dehydratase [Candidatus Cloacimonadota bacterium]